MHKALMAGLVVGLCACTPTGTGNSSSSSSGDAAAPWTMTDYVRAYQLARCALEQRCKDVRGPLYTSQASCEQGIADFDVEQQSVTGVGLYAYFEENYTLADETRARACVAHLGTVECTAATLDSPDCDDASVLKTPRTDGQTCNGPWEEPLLCDAATLYCGAQTDNQSCFTCQPLKADGAACESWMECGSRFCSQGGQCAAPAPAASGAACNQTEDCAGDLACTGSADAGRACAPRGSAGAQCANAPCLTDLACVPDSANVLRCTERLADGATCDRNGTGPGCRHACIFSSADADQGTCSVFTDLPVADQPCVRIRESLPNLCKPLTTIFPDFTVQFVENRQVLVACTCKATVGANDPCFHNGACGGGRCVGVTRMGDFQSPGTCQPKLILGERCQRSSDCASGLCDPNAGAMPECAAPAPCP